MRAGEKVLLITTVGTVLLVKTVVLLLLSLSGTVSRDACR
jgi:hypothetical protein